ncbi:hypothetical protein CPC08DRAFT_243535 [Agrocybe pediades]|nr:hypothetical protein CPC08DRAFT_243535 [Agrocybe pediades]
MFAAFVLDQDSLPSKPIDQSTKELGMLHEPINCARSGNIGWKWWLFVSFSFVVYLSLSETHNWNLKLALGNIFYPPLVFMFFTFPIIYFISDFHSFHLIYVRSSQKLNIFLLLTGITFAYSFNGQLSLAPLARSGTSSSVNSTTPSPRSHRTRRHLSSFDIHLVVLSGALSVPDATRRFGW